MAPILRRYFASRDQNDDPDIYTHAYISSSEITSYDRTLEGYLKDRIARSKSRTEITTTKSKAVNVTQRLGEFNKKRPQSGDLQIITGGVGAGKSLFARRYKEHLQPSNIASVTHWAFIDFNYAPEDLSNANEWVCKEFAESIIVEGAPLDLLDAADQERIFASNLRSRQAYYERMDAARPGSGAIERARDIEQWRTDPEKLALGIARYFQGDRGDNIVAVFDNVDRRDSGAQLAAFQTALWFMGVTRCFVILQMRDVTFELYKNDPPLDTYKTGQIFHIVPPRFINVVRKRLELSLETLAKEAPEVIAFRTSSGTRIEYPKSKAGVFLRFIYEELFQTPTNVARVLEALAGRNVRRALDMFLAILTSGHISEESIASVALGKKTRSIPEWTVIRILMRQDYRYFSDHSGFVANIFFAESQWERPSNFIIIETLFLLIGERKAIGDNGQMGFVSVSRAVQTLERMGFVERDIVKALHFALEKELIEADTFTVKKLKNEDCLKVTASGWAHMRILSSRLEYLAAVLPTTAIDDKKLRANVFDRMNIEHKFGSLRLNQAITLVEAFRIYLEKQYKALTKYPGYQATEKTGAAYVLGKIDDAITFARREANQSEAQIDWLDM